MKKFLVLLAALMILGPATAYSEFWTGSVNDGFGNWAENVQTFDWDQAGSGVAIGLADPANVFVGAEFTFLYQSRLVSLSDPDGGNVAFPGLNTTFEYTLVASFTEKVSQIVDLGPAGILAVFETTGEGSWYLLHDFAANSNTLAGTGFQDGTIVAQGGWLTDQFSTFTATIPGEEGIGSYKLEGIRGFGTEVDPNFLDPTLYNGEQLIYDIRFEGTINIPALDSTTTTFFGGDGPYDAYTVTAADLLFKVDASSRFSVIPEPSTVILLGLGLLGLAGYSRKKFRK